ncbi:MAG: DoxX family protein [Bacteroidia bacterium]|nr:DoxX family protein [Bacteroidia bacterium]
MKTLAYILRLLVGVLFIFSGFIKANDPMGFGFKMEEYFTVFGMDWAKPLALSLSVFVCIYEIVFGFFLLAGYRVMLTLWALLLMILYFTALTFYSAYFNKVTDCGCFGDFLHLKPWESFWKDIVLMALLICLFFFRKHIRPVFGGKLMGVFLFLVIAASVAFPVYTYNYLPVFDFRPYKIGTNIIEASSIPEGAPLGKTMSYFIYENLKTGEKKEFDMNHLPWQDTLTWKYSEKSRDVILEEAYVPPIHDFHINTLDGFEYTEDILKDPGYKFFLVSYSLDIANESAFREMNDFAELCRKNNIPFMVLTASSDQVESFKQKLSLNMDFYLVDATQLKTMIRANPGLVMLKGPVVVDMWHYHSFPSFTEVQSQYMK